MHKNVTNSKMIIGIMIIITAIIIEQSFVSSSIATDKRITTVERPLVEYIVIIQRIEFEKWRYYTLSEIIDQYPDISIEIKNDHHIIIHGDGYIEDQLGIVLYMKKFSEKKLYIPWRIIDFVAQI